jgi:hypothetical protein
MAVRIAVSAVTILTDPVPIGRYWLTERLRRAVRAQRDRLTPPPAFTRSNYRGHFAVTRSLVEGLKKLGVGATYNPASCAGVGRTVGVLSGVSALRQAIGWKRQGRIDRLIAGPNVVDFPSQYDGLIGSREVDLCVTPSVFVRNFYEEDCPALRGRCAAWPAGVDVDYWCPGDEAAPRGRHILIFEKPLRWPLESSAAYAALLRDRGYEVSVIRYGHYLPAGYRRLLRQSALMVAFASTESQGLAWAEAWATNVPTLVWRRDEITFDHPTLGPRVYATSTAPYLSSQTGAFFDGVGSFTALVDSWEADPEQYSPRAWVLEHMSDEACARHYLSLAGIA